MLNPFLGLILSLTVIQTNLIPIPEAKVIEIKPIQSISQDIATNDYQSFTNSFDFYNNYTLPKLQQIEAAEAEQRRIEEEKKKEEERKAQLAASQRAATVQNRMQGRMAIQGFDSESLIRERCSLLGCDATQVIRVMYCESGGRPNAYNPGGYHGLFQFAWNTFHANAKRIGISAPNIWDPTQQVMVATAMFSAGQAWQWACK